MISRDTSGKTASLVTGFINNLSYTNNGQLLIIGIYVTAGILPDSYTVTYNGIACIYITETFESDFAQYIGFWYLANPPIGTFFIDVSTGTSSTFGFTAVSYIGANAIDSFNTAQRATPVTVSTTVINSGCWLVGLGVSAGGSGSLTSNRTDLQILNGSTLSDSNGTVGTGSQSIIYSQTASPSIGGIAMSITYKSSSNGLLMVSD